MLIEDQATLDAVSAAIADLTGCESPRDVAHGPVQRDAKGVELPPEVTFTNEKGQHCVLPGAAVAARMTPPKKASKATAPDA